MEPSDIQKLITEGLNHFNISYSPQMIEKLFTYLHELHHWNTRVNLTARRPLEWVIRELLYDSFFLCSALGGPSSALDMGSGSGVLALPIAILNESVKVFSVDRSLRKIQFQRHIKRILEIENVSLIHARIETLEPLDVDALVSKGFGTAKLILDKGGKHIKAEGAAYLLKGPAESGGAVPGFVLEEVRRYGLPRTAKEYRLFIYRKIGAIS